MADSGKQDPSPDDGVRGRSGVVVSMVDAPDGKVRLVFDDVQRNGSSWSHQFLFTSVELDRKALLETTLTDAELASLGFAIAIRLAAHKRVVG